jgi:hypothetical protein
MHSVMSPPQFCHACDRDATPLQRQLEPWSTTTFYAGSTRVSSQPLDRIQKRFTETKLWNGWQYSIF